VVFASETYGWRLASELGARFVPADPGRSLHPVSGTLVREDPWKHWALLTPPVQRHLRLRVAIHGAESTGKTTLAAALAARLVTAWVPEYARTLLEAQEGRLTYDDLDTIARGQAASQAALEAAAGPVLVCDTDAAATAVWSEVLFERVSTTVRDAAAAVTADLTLLTDPSVPYEADLVRYRPADDRPAFTTRLREALTARGRRVVMVQGDLEARLETALREIERLRPRDL
jgi:NadR type nicotinamide-nucleotide adenylyltransferase